MSIVSEGGTSSRIVDIFNSAVAAWSISAATELGTMDELHAARRLDVGELARRRGLDEQSTVGMFRALAAVGIVRLSDGIVTTAPGFDDAYRNKSFFHWLGRGSGELFREMPVVMRLENREGDYYRRDAAAVARACKEIDLVTYAPTFRAALDRLEVEPAVVVDLGCGSGARLLDLLHRYPGARGVGVDIAESAIEVARENARVAGAEDRVRFVRADVLRLEPDPAFAEAELVTCFMMGHDFWPRSTCVATLRRLRQVFPRLQRFLLGDATRTGEGPDRDTKIFTLGFELGHDLMGTFIPTIDDWLSVFDESGWSVARTNRIDAAVGEVIFELA